MQNIADWSSSPSATISHLLSEIDGSIDQISEEIGSEILTVYYEHSPISSDLAEKISQKIGGSPEFWMRRDSQFQSEISHDPTIDEEQWVRELPYAEIAKNGWVPQTRKIHEKIENTLDYFECDTLIEWQLRYKKLIDGIAFRTTSSFDANSLATLAWLRRAEITTPTEKLPQFDPKKLEQSIPELRRLCRIADPSKFLPIMTEICANSGVGLAVIKAPKGCRASGATRILTNQRAILQLSFRHLSDDHFWFTFFHEVAHLTLHHETHLFLEGTSAEKDHFEDEANQFASDTLIPKRYWELIQSSNISTKQIIKLAYKIGISAGILVGQMQHENLIDPSRMNFLKRRYKWN